MWTLQKRNPEFYTFSESLQTESAEFHAAKIKEPESKTLAKYNSVHIYEKDMASILIFLQERNSNNFPYLLKRINNKTVPGI